jgi:hypothetical protein
MSEAILNCGRADVASVSALSGDISFWKGGWGIQVARKLMQIRWWSAELR